MQDYWKTLEDAGLPDGEIRPVPVSLDLASVRAAVAAIVRSQDPLAAARREPLLAWLRAWQHHWPASFMKNLGADGESLVSRLMAAEHDSGRYLKLRRLAIENLSRVL